MTASRSVPAAAGALFDVLADPQRHAELDGSGTVRGEPAGPARLYAGAQFTMSMKQQAWGYRSTNRVVEFEEGRLTAWASMGTWHDHQIVGGQHWRWLLTPTETGTLVEHSYVWGHARFALLTVWLPGYPRRAKSTLPRSIARLEAAAVRDQR